MSMQVNGYVGGVVSCNGKTMTITSNKATVLTGSAWSGGGNPGNGNLWNLTGAQGYYSPAGGLLSDVHPYGAIGAMISLVQDEISNTHNDYFVSQAGTPVVSGSPYGFGTYAYPLSIGNLNAQTGSAGYTVLPTGLTGKKVQASGTIITPFVTPSPGTSAAPFTIAGARSFTGGYTINQPYWSVLPSSKSGSSLLMLLGN
jgi:hypothetical protein